MPLIEVKIPPMGESITSGVLAKWRVNDGDAVKKDQPIYELETDKITAEGTAEAAGRIALKAAAGAEVKIGAVVATIDPAAGAGEASKEAGKPAEGPTPASAPAAAAAGARGAAKQAGTPAGVPTPAGAPAAAAEPAGAPPAAKAAASPAVRRIAAETGVDPASVPGTGKAGRVTKGDMLSASESKPAAGAAPVAAPEAARPEATAEDRPAAAPAPAAFPAPPQPARQTRRKLTPLRQRIAERLVSAKRDTAMLTTFQEADMSAVTALRARCQEEFVNKNGFKLGLMSFFTKAVVHALKEVPAVNAQIEGDTIIENHFYDIGVAVSTEKGLMVPVIRDCDRLDMAQIEAAIAEAAKKARDGKIALSDLEGGVFTITNGGIFGSMLSTPILNPPQSAILGLHAIAERPVAVNGQVVVRPIMYLALSYDHRVIDGREAVSFLVTVKRAIEDPARLLLGL